MKKYSLFNIKSWKKNYFYKNSSTLLFCQKNEETKETDETYVTSHCFSAWPSRRTAARSLFLNNCTDVKAYSDIDFRVLDIPELLSAESSVAEDFIAMLRKTNNPDLFASYSVASIIQERFKRSSHYFFAF